MNPDFIPALLEASLRSLAGAIALYAGLRIFKVTNVLAQKAAWGLVLTASMLMPMLMRWQGLPVSAAIKLPVPPWRNTLKPPPAVQLRSSSESAAELSSEPRPQHRAAPNPPAMAGDRFPAPVVSISRFMPPAPDRPTPAQYPHQTSAPGSATHSFRPLTLAALLYLTVCAGLLLRIVYGVAKALKIWNSAAPILTEMRPPFTSGMSLRSSKSVSSPVTIGSAVVLPVDYAEWDTEKLRIVLAHENAHIRQGDFYLQVLAGLNTAVFWFSPLGWWLKRKLSELGETISDRAGLEEAASSASYAQVLLEFAALPRPTFIGVAMARRSNVSHRIERLLNESSFRQAFAGSRRMLLAVLLVPIVLFTATAQVRVEAAGKAPQPSPSAPSLTPQAHPDPAPASIEPSAQESAMPPAPKSPAAPAPPIGPGSTAVPDGAQSWPSPPDPPSASVDINAAIAPVSPVPAAAMAEGQPSEFSFERTLSVSGKLEFSVATGSGNIHLTRGQENKVHIVGKITVNPGGNEERAREIAANPPIHQAGNIIRIESEREGMRNISIDYEIEAPPDALLNATCGSGNLTVEGVGDSAKLTTGSGNIRATGLHGGFSILTGSGEIYVEQTGDGDGKVQTGSGNVEVKSVHGALHAQTGSGNIKASGAPTTDWKLETGSGDIDYWPGNAPLTVDASTGSGNIHTDREMLTQGSMSADQGHHRIVGKLNGGGPTVRLEIGSGDVRVH